MRRGYFITVEGGEGAGKTTQIDALAATLTERGREVVITREPGGTPAAEAVRDLLSHPAFGGDWSPRAEALLMFAVRAMHIRDVIAPALAQEKIVISDRYIDSTRAYQGYLQGVSRAFIQSLEQEVVGDVVPDLTLILDLPVATAMARVAARGAVDHYDRADQQTHQILRDAFLDIAAQEPERCVVIDASREPGAIAQEIALIVSAKTGITG